MGGERGGWRLVHRRGVSVVRNVGFDAIPGLTHGFSTRRGEAAEDFDLADGVDEGRDRLRRLERSLRLPVGSIRLLRQVHGSRIVGARDEAAEVEADGIVISRGDRPWRTAAVRTADCVPILLADAEGTVVAAVHAGWRGSALSVVRRAVEALGERGAPPRGLRAAVGPAVGPCCYEVDDQVGRAVAATLSDPSRATRDSGAGKVRVDLKAANAAQLGEAGLPAGAVAVAPWCTVCSPELFFSHRREGAGAGRMVSCVGFEEPAAAAP